MKLTITVLLTLISILGFSQSDSISYQYRIGIKDITSNGSAKLVQDPLADLFKTTPTYQETLNVFVFESKEDIKKEELILILPSSFNNITYFKKHTIKISNLE